MNIAEVIKDGVENAFGEFFGEKKYPETGGKYPYPEKGKSPLEAFPEKFPGKEAFEEWLKKQQEGIPTEEEKYPEPEFMEMNKPNPEGMAKFEKVVKNEGVELKDREIFAVGNWKGIDFSDERLEQMIENFHALKEKVKVPLKLSHENNCCQADPAIGWVSDLRKKDGSIYADFKHVPKKVADLIEKKAFSRPSIELQDQYNGHKDVIVGVAFLGADLPEVDDIDDLLSLYQQEPKDNQVFEYEKPQKPEDKNKEEKIVRVKKEEIERLQKEAEKEIVSLDLSAKSEKLLRSCHPNLEFELESKENQKLLFDILTTQSAESRSVADTLLRMIPTRR